MPIASYPSDQSPLPQQDASLNTGSGQQEVSPSGSWSPPIADHLASAEAANSGSSVGVIGSAPSLPRPSSSPSLLEYAGKMGTTTLALKKLLDDMTLQYVVSLKTLSGAYSTMAAGLNGQLSRPDGVLLLPILAPGQTLDEQMMRELLFSQWKNAISTDKRQVDALRALWKDLQQGGGNGDIKLIEDLLTTLKIPVWGGEPLEQSQLHDEEKQARVSFAKEVTSEQLLLRQGKTEQVAPETAPILHKEEISSNKKEEPTSNKKEEPTRPVSSKEKPEGSNERQEPVSSNRLIEGTSSPSSFQRASKAIQQAKPKEKPALVGKAEEPVVFKGEDKGSPIQGKSEELPLSLKEGEELSLPLKEREELSLSLKRGEELSLSLKRGEELSLSLKGGGELPLSLKEGEELPLSLKEREELSLPLKGGEELFAKTEPLKKGEKVAIDPLQKGAKEPIADLSQPIENTQKPEAEAIRLLPQEPLEELQLPSKVPSEAVTFLSNEPLVAKEPALGERDKNLEGDLVAGDSTISRLPFQEAIRSSSHQLLALSLYSPGVQSLFVREVGEVGLPPSIPAGLWHRAQFAVQQRTMELIHLSGMTAVKGAIYLLSSEPLDSSDSKVIRPLLAIAQVKELLSLTLVAQPNSELVDKGNPGLTEEKTPLRLAIEQVIQSDPELLQLPAEDRERLLEPLVRQSTLALVKFGLVQLESSLSQENLVQQLLQVVIPGLVSPQKEGSPSELSATAALPEKPKEAISKREEPLASKETPLASEAKPLPTKEEQGVAEPLQRRERAGKKVEGATASSPPLSADREFKTDPNSVVQNPVAPVEKSNASSPSVEVESPKGLGRQQADPMVTKPLGSRGQQTEQIEQRSIGREESIEVSPLIAEKGRTAPVARIANRSSHVEPDKTGVESVRTVDPGRTIEPGRTIDNPVEAKAPSVRPRKEAMAPSLPRQETRLEKPLEAMATPVEPALARQQTVPLAAEERPEVASLPRVAKELPQFEEQLQKLLGRLVEQRPEAHQTSPIAEASVMVEQLAIVASAGDRSPLEFSREVQRQLLERNVQPKEAAKGAFKALLLLVRQTKEGKELLNQLPLPLLPSLGNLLQRENSPKRIQQLTVGLLLQQGIAPEKAKELASQLVPLFLGEGRPLVARLVESPTTVATLTKSIPLSSSLSRESFAESSLALPSTPVDERELSERVERKVFELFAPVVGREQAEALAKEVVELIGISSVTPEQLEVLERRKPNSIVQLIEREVEVVKEHDHVEGIVQRQEEKQTEGFRQFISLHTDLSVWAQKLLDPGALIYMTWGLMNKGIGKKDLEKIYVG